MVTIDVAADAALADLSAEEAALIARAEEISREILAQRAVAVDLGEGEVRESLGELAAAGLAGINVPREFGGAQVRRSAEMRIVEALAAGDGTIPFLIVQHYGTSLMVADSPNNALRRAVLPSMATGASMNGFGVSHVRREGRPVLGAVPEGDGYRLDGSIPWITGQGIFEHIVIAATLPDEQILQAWVPLRESDHLHLGAPMQLVAMNAARTVSATVEGLFIRPSDVLDIAPNRLRGRPNAVAVPCLLGLARATVADLYMQAERRGSAITATAADRLSARLARVRAGFYRLIAEGGERDAAEVSRARAEATRLAFEAIPALIVASGGGANSLTHPAQRRLREASVFATWGLNAGAIQAALDALSS